MGLPGIQKRGVEKVTHHEEWNNKDFRGGYDIALVRVDKPIVLFYVSSHIIPVKCNIITILACKYIYLCIYMCVCIYNILYYI